MMGLASPSFRPVNLRDDSITVWISYDRMVSRRAGCDVLSDAISSRELPLQAIDAAKCYRGHAMLRSTISMVAVTNDPLPFRMTGEEFQACAGKWSTV